MYGYRVLDVNRVASGVSHHHRNLSGAGNAKDQFVALLQAVERQVQSAQLIFAEGISASDIADELRGSELP